MPLQYSRCIQDIRDRELFRSLRSDEQKQQNKKFAEERLSFWCCRKYLLFGNYKAGDCFDKRETYVNSSCLWSKKKIAIHFARFPVCFCIPWPFAAARLRASLPCSRPRALIFFRLFFFYRSLFTDRLSNCSFQDVIYIAFARESFIANSFFPRPVFLDFAYFEPFLSCKVRELLLLHRWVFASL